MKTCVMIGDSHSQIVFPLIKNDLPFVFNEIISKQGWGIKKYMDEGLVQSLPSADVCIVALGGNNQNMKVTEYTEELKQFLKILNSKYKRIVWIGTYHSTDPSVNLRHSITNMFLRFNLPITVGFIDVYKISKDIPKRDGVHLERDGYKIVVNKIKRKVIVLSTSTLLRVLLGNIKTMTYIAGVSTGIAAGFIFSKEE